MTPGSPTPPTPPTKPKTKVSVPTHKLILGIVELYKMKDPRPKELAADLAGCVLESYSDKEEMIRDIIGTYIAKKKITTIMKLDMKRTFKEDAKILSEIFGVFLFGEKL